MSKQKNKSRKWWIIGILVVAVAGIAAYFGKNKEEVKVEVKKVAKQTLLASVTESGVIQPVVELKIAADVSGEIVHLPFKEGDEVKKGDLLVTIRPDNYLSALEQANASANASNANYHQSLASAAQAKSRMAQDSTNFARVQGLFNEKVISRQEYENSKAQYEISQSQYESAKQAIEAAFFQRKSSEANVSQARQNLSKTNINAPMEGVITLLNQKPGERVVGTMQMQGTEILRIADLSAMEVKVEINENDIVQLRRGDSAWVEVDAYPERKFRGIVTEISYSATVTGLGSSDQITNFEVKVQIVPASYQNDKKIMRDIPLGQSPFRPGMSAQVQIFTDISKDVVSVPIQAVTLRKSTKDSTQVSSGKSEKPREVVYVLEGNTAHERQVKTGINDLEFIEIIEGLSPNETVIIGPYNILSQQLKDQDQVSILTEEDKNKTKKKWGN